MANYDNTNESKEERRFKYHLCKALGNSSANAQRMKNWTYAHIALNSKRFHYKENDTI